MNETFTTTQLTQTGQSFSVCLSAVQIRSAFLYAFLRQTWAVPKFTVRYDVIWPLTLVLELYRTFSGSVIGYHFFVRFTPMQVSDTTCWYVSIFCRQQHLEMH